jgi:replicative DNA helicase
LAESSIFIDDSPGISSLEVRAKARRLKSREDIGLIIIDYLQLMQGRLRVENRQQEISEISRSLKSLARELSIPVIALSQLSRAVESREPPRPRLADLRESGAIEQDADLVAFLYREEYYKKETDENRGIAELNIAKQRNGPVGNIKLTFIKEYTRFENSARLTE